MKNEIFPLSHVVLYAKGWYMKSDNIWTDLMSMLNLDGYTPFIKNDAYFIILNRFSEFNHRATTLTEVMKGIKPMECWKIGYDCKINNNKPEDYDTDTAVIYYILSTLRFLDKTQWNVATPIYRKHPKNPLIPIKEVIDMFGKNR